MGLDTFEPHLERHSAANGVGMADFVDRIVGNAEAWAFRQGEIVTQKKLISAGIAYAVALITALLALWSQPGVENLSDVGQVPYVIAILGPLANVLKDIRSSMRNSEQ